MPAFVGIVHRVALAVGVQVPEFLPVSPIHILADEAPALAVVVPRVHVGKPRLLVQQRPCVSEAPAKRPACLRAPVG